MRRTPIFAGVAAHLLPSRAISQMIRMQRSLRCEAYCRSPFISALWRRFLVRLLLVHGTLADYRLGRLIKYSFYKNITFAFIFLFFQPFNGVSGQVHGQVLAGYLGASIL